MNGQKERVLVIEDELPMRTALSDALAAEGYRVIVADDGEVGLERALRERPDIILLDVMMPILDGFAVCAELRKRDVQCPILFLTAKGMVKDRVTGLNSGGDDYLVKPFSTEELLARVRALLRRKARTTSEPATLQLGETVIDFERLTATKNGRSLRLTRKEFAMLRLLAQERGRVVTRERFLDVVWSYAAFPTTRTVDNHIAKLRSCLEPDPENPSFILTVHRAGYKLAEFANP